MVAEVDRHFEPIDRIEEDGIDEIQLGLGELHEAVTAAYFRI